MIYLEIQINTQRGLHANQYSKTLGRAKEDNGCNDNEAGN